MSSGFNKRLFFDNLEHILDCTGMKIGDFEIQAGVSTGYMSRVKKDENSKPGIDFIVNAAKIIQTSVDTLINVDLSDKTETQRYLINFLDKLSIDTQLEKLYWLSNSPHYYETFEADINGNVSHPLFSQEVFNEEDEVGFHHQVCRVVFTSKNFGVNTYVNRDSFELRLKNGTMLYLMAIEKTVHAMNDMNAQAIEMWISNGYDSKQYLCSTQDDGSISYRLNVLYNNIVEYSKHPHVEKEFRDAIDAFMINDIKDDPDDGLPF